MFPLFIPFFSVSPNKTKRWKEKLKSFPIIKTIFIITIQYYYYYLAASNFFWTQSHAIGSYSCTSSRTQTPNQFSSSQQRKYESDATEQSGGASAQRSCTLASDASKQQQQPYRPESQTTDSTKTPIVQTKITDSSLSSQSVANACDAATTTTASKSSPPCNECGATIA